MGRLVEVSVADDAQPGSDPDLVNQFRAVDRNAARPTGRPSYRWIGDTSNCTISVIRGR